MSQSTAIRSVTIVNPQGIHLRPAGLFVKLANQYQASIEVVKGNERFDGKSVLSLLTIGGVQGTPLTLHATGPDAEQAVEALSALLAQGFGEMDPPADG